MKERRSIIEALLNGSRRHDDTFEALLADLPTATELEIAKEQGMELSDIVRGCERRLDALGAMALLLRDDPALPWERAGLLDELGRDGKAFHEFLEAARRFENLIGTGESVVPDEADWARPRLLGREILLPRAPPVSAAVVGQRVETDEHRLELQNLIGAKALE